MKVIKSFLTALMFSALSLHSSNIKADGGVRFSNLSKDPGSSLSEYRRTPSVRDGNWDFFLDNTGPFSLADAATKGPFKSRGAPGVCLFDYDGDEDLDIYVTNGPGTPNSLFSSILKESGSLSFVDKAITAGVAATEEDSSGCAAGDIDNDGDQDLLVLAMGKTNRLFLNNGDGTFQDISEVSGVGGDNRWSASATLADIDNDGLLDIFIGNVADLNSSLSIFVVPTDFNQHNQLLINNGNNTFTDVSKSAGIENLTGMLVDTDGDGIGEPIAGKPAGLSWAIAGVDIDLDGDVDLMTGDDQAVIPPVGNIPSPFGGPNADRGLVHLFKNDGSGAFVDSIAGRPGAWMGLAFGDFNHDGKLDYFGSNIGDGGVSLAFGAPTLGLLTSRWFFGRGDGTFVDSVPSPGDPLPGLNSAPFGWGVSAFDYDNDGDTDIIFAGGLNGIAFLSLDNPMAVLENDGVGNFVRDTTAFSALDSQRHALAIEHGLAVGDLNNDGFVDLVSVAAFEVPMDIGPPLVFPNPFTFNSPFDDISLAGAVFSPNSNDPSMLDFVPAFRDYPDGRLSVEINSGDNHNGWVSIKLKGTIGITTLGRVNRDGVGATVNFTPRKGKSVMKPIVAGSSYASQHSLIANFGLGRTHKGTVDVLWPGGVRNRLYGVKNSETILFPEIPCSFEADWNSFKLYRTCVRKALRELVRDGVINRRQAARFRISAITAFFKH